MVQFEVLNAVDAVLTNAEVYEHVRDRRKARQGPAPASAASTSSRGDSCGDRNWLEHKMLKYFDKSATGEVQAEKAQLFLERLKEVDADGSYDLTVIEKVQLMNLRPTEPVEVLMICPRLTEEQMETILQLLAETLTSDELPSGLDTVPGQ